MLYTCNLLERIAGVVRFCRLVNYMSLAASTSTILGTLYRSQIISCNTMNNLVKCKIIPTRVSSNRQVQLLTDYYAKTKLVNLIQQFIGGVYNVPRTAMRTFYQYSNSI